MSFFKSLESTLGKVKDFFISGKAQADLQLVAELAIQAAPYAAEAAQIAAGFAPQPAGAIALATISAIEMKYPQLFDGSLKTKDQRDLFTLGVATDLMAAKFPNASTTVVRAALHLALIGNGTPTVTVK